MNNKEWVRNRYLFLQLPEERKILFFSFLAHELTVFARGAYPEQGQNNGESTNKLMAFNEMEHNITSQLAHMLAKNEKRYPDEVFADILFEKAQTANCESDLVVAFDFAFKRLLLVE